MSKEYPRGIYGTRKLADTEAQRRQFENLCKIQCTLEEVSGVFEVSEDTVRRWVKRNYGEESTFESVYKIYGASGRASLRRFQMKQAETNSIMGIWLGKQYLKQKDIIENHNIDYGQDDPLTKAIKAEFGIIDEVEDAESETSQDSDNDDDFDDTDEIEED